VANLLSDPSVYLRKRLLALMTQHQYRQALPSIRPLLRVENASTRSAALQAVTLMEDTSSTGEVVWMSFHDSNPFVRVQAVQSLVALSGMKAIPHLLTLAGDANFQVRRSAIARLVELTPPVIDARTQAPEEILTSLARFSIEFPEDEMVPAISELLKKHNFNPESLPAHSPVKAMPIPPDLLAEVPNLVVLLDRWRLSLRRGGESTGGAGEEGQQEWSGTKHQDIEAALSLLIRILAEARDQS
jgi:hypothetical protein